MSKSSNSTESQEKTASSTASFSSILASAVIRRVKLPGFFSASGSTSSIKIDEIQLGTAIVDRVDIQDVDTRLSTGAISLENARAIVSLKISFKFSVHIPLPWPFDDINFGDTVAIGTVRFPFDIGDISVPALNQIELDIPSVVLEDIQASLESVKNLDLGRAQFDGLKLEDTLIPAAGFGLGGLTLGAVNVDGVRVPSISSERLTLESFSPDAPLILPSISVQDVMLPSTTAPRVESDGAIVVPNVASEQREIPLIPAGPLRASITIDPKLTIAIGSMVINDISAISSVKKIDLQNLQSRIGISGISLEGVELNSVELESISSVA